MPPPIKRDHRYVLCPFFLWKGRKHRRQDPECLTYEVWCEGVIPDTKTKIRFGNRSERDKQMEIFCKSHNYRCCEMYRALIHIKYGDDEGYGMDQT